VLIPVLAPVFLIHLLPARYSREYMWLTDVIWRLEIEDMLRMPAEPTLDMLDTALNRFITFCASYHGV
jgi:hypothetical protein